MAEYDVRDCCLAYLAKHQERAERLRVDAGAKVVSLIYEVQEAEKAADRLQQDVDALVKKLERYRGMRRVSDRVKNNRVALRDMKLRLREVRAKVRKLRRDWRDAEREQDKYALIVKQLGGVYARVERTWIPGCLVQHEPVFVGLVPEF